MLASRTFNQGGVTIHQIVDLNDLKEAVKNDKEGRGRCFFVQNNTWQMKTILLRNNMHVMTQALKGGDGPHLPHSLSVVNMYTEAISGSNQFVVVVKNLMAVPITVEKGIKVAQVVGVNVVPPVGIGTQNFRGAR